MKTCPFCNINTSVEPLPSTGKPRFLRRTWQGIQWLFPTTLLILMPKCPMCVAAYIALFTGIGVSVSAAHWIQILMVALCLGSLLYLALKLARSLARHRSQEVPFSPR